MRHIKGSADFIFLVIAPLAALLLVLGAIAYHSNSDTNSGSLYDAKYYYLLKDGTRHTVLILRDGSHALLESESIGLYHLSKKLDKLERSEGRSPERSSN